MGKTRQLAKQELTRANGSIDWCYNHLKTFLDMGYDEREDFVEPVKCVIASLEATKIVIDDIKSKI